MISKTAGRGFEPLCPCHFFSRFSVYWHRRFGECPQTAKQDGGTGQRQLSLTSIGMLGVAIAMRTVRSPQSGNFRRGPAVWHLQDYPIAAGRAQVKRASVAPTALPPFV